MDTTNEAGVGTIPDLMLLAMNDALSTVNPTT